MPPREGGATSCLQLRARLSTQKIEVSLAQDNRQEDEREAGEQARGERLPISSTENSTPEGDSIERSSEPVEAGTCARPTFWMSRATHVQPTERNAIAVIKLGVHTDRGAWVSNSSDVARLSTPLPTNIQNVMTLMSICDRTWQSPPSGWRKRPHPPA